MSKNFSDAEIQDLIAELLDPSEVIAFRPRIARALRSTSATLFLCQAIYWQRIARQAGSEDFYKLRDAEVDAEGNILPPSSASRQSWEWELGMGRSEQETARKILEKHNLIKTMSRGLPAKLHYRVNLPEIAKFLLKNQQIARKSPTRRVESDQQEGEENTSKLDENSPSSRLESDQHTEITYTEITQEINSNNTFKEEHEEKAAAPSSISENEDEYLNSKPKKRLQVDENGVMTAKNEDDVLKVQEIYQMATLDEVKAAVESLVPQRLLPWPANVFREIVKAKVETEDVKILIKLVQLDECLTKAYRDSFYLAKVLSNLLEKTKEFLKNNSSRMEPMYMMGKVISHAAGSMKLSLEYSFKTWANPNEHAFLQDIYFFDFEEFSRDIILGSQDRVAIQDWVWSQENTLKL